MEQPARWKRDRLQRIWLRAAALLWVSGAMTVTGCSSDDSDAKDSGGSSPSASSTATSTNAPSKSADPTEEAKADVVALYRTYWDQMERVYAKGSTKGTDIKRYAAGPALVGAERGAGGMYEAGRAVTGNVTVGSPTVTKMDLGRKVPSVTISSCLDVSKWQVVDRDTKKKIALPAERLTKYVIVATVEQWPEGWRVIKDEPQEKAC